MAKYVVLPGWSFVAANGAVSQPGQVVELDDTKITPGENLRKATKKDLAPDEPDAPSTDDTQP